MIQQHQLTIPQIKHIKPHELCIQPLANIRQAFIQSCCSIKGLKGRIIPNTDAKTGKLINENPSENYMLKLEDGKLYKATIQLESYRDRTYVALRAPIPSGAEILDSTFVTTGYEGESDTGSSSWRHWISNKYIMDNEIQFFWDNFRSGSTSVTFTFRAARRGIYPLPPVQAECMYEPEIFGRSDGYLSIIE